MPGQKRKSSGSFPMSDSKSSSDVSQMFKLYQAELDLRHDKYERIVKLSRDITIQSKRVIFSLLRKDVEHSVLISDGISKLDDIQTLLQKIWNELENEDIFAYRRAFSPGIQEFIESVALLAFIEDGSFLTYSVAVDKYFKSYVSLLIPTDYLLGVADLTGELMRLSINTISNSGKQEYVYSILDCLRRIHQEFGIFIDTEKGLKNKYHAMDASLKKVEKACYAVYVRRSELPPDCSLPEMNFE